MAHILESARATILHPASVSFFARLVLVQDVDNYFNLLLGVEFG